MRRRWLSALSLVVLLATETGGGAQSLSCHGTQRPKQIAELLFGRNVGSRLGVSERAWAHFLARELTPSFPDGLTVTDAWGQWRDPVTGRIVHEPTKRVEIVLPGGVDDEARLNAVAEAYKHQFRQQSVGLILRAACVAF